MSKYIKTLDISGKHALITGASSGIGRACAFMLAERGARLTLVARREQMLLSVRSEILENHPDVSIDVIVLDVTDKEAGMALPDRAGRVDILINSAGLALGTSKADNFDLKDAERMFETNAIASISFFRAFVPMMRKVNSGHVVNIGSVAGFECYEGGSVYSASKHAILAFSNAARMDLVDTDVKVTVINPGIVDTEFWNVRFNGDAEKAAGALKGIEPLTSWDIAYQVMSSITRPQNSQIAEIRSYCNHQAHAKYVIYRKV